VIAADRIRLWRENPVAFVREVFGVEPDAWQVDVLMAFPTRPRVAMAACKGPGKTATLAWLAWNFLVTRPHPKIAATSISGDNLADGLWTEMAKWQRKSPLLTALFTWTKTRIFANESPETWWMSARTWPRSASSEQQADTLAGLHADYMLFIIDEAGGVPDTVMVAAEAGLASCIEGHLLIAGNPTHLEGPLYRACTTESHLWFVVHITGDPDDPKRSPRVSVQWAREQIEKYGRESPWVLVNVFGRFPPSSINALLGPDEVREAMGRRYESHQYSFASVILGVDVARQGDDRSCIVARQGLYVAPPVVLRIQDSLAGASRVAMEQDKWQADAVHIDATGGYGVGWIDALRGMRRQAREVQFAGKPTDGRFLNKRAEMYWDMAQWVRDGGWLPNVPELVGELCTPTYSYRGDKFQLEGKDEIKERLGRSPDIADALACTFAFPVPLKSRLQAGAGMAIGHDDPIFGR
jgi:phage terminase large subunit